MGGGLGALLFFCHLENALKVLISFRMSPVATFWDDWVDMITWRKNKKRNKQTRIRDVFSGKK